MLFRLLTSGSFHVLYFRPLNAALLFYRIQPSESGGKPRVLILLSTLSPKAIRTYQAKSEIQQIANDKPWYVDADVERYIATNKEEYFSAVELKSEIEKFLTESVANKSEEAFAERLKMSTRNLKRKISAYYKGTSWALAMEEQDGKNHDYYKVLALCRVPRKDKGEHVSMTGEIKAVIQNIWFDPKFATNQRTQKALYELLEDMAKEKGWLLLPSYQTVNRYINELTTLYSNEHYLARFGEREYKRNKLPKNMRDIGSLQVMELVQGDAHTFDCWVEVELDGKKTAVRPYLVGLIDTRSRVLVGWAICICPNNRIIKKMLMNMMYPKENSPVQGVPRIILIDNGKDWTAQTLTGRNRTERISLDGEIKGFYKSIGIEDDMRALPYQPWTKAHIERFFRTLTNKFSKSFESYTGTLTAQYTTSKIKKDIPKMLEAGKLIPIDEFAKHFEHWLNEKYHNKEHSGLKKQKEATPTPFGVWENAERYIKASPPIDYARMLLLTVEERYVYPTGFKLHNNIYNHQLLGKYVDQYIDIRFDPDDLDMVYAYSKDGKKICEVKANQLLNPLASKNDEFLIEHIAGQKRHMKATKKQLAELTTPYEDRQKEAQPVMLPELSDETQTVVALPQDKQYQEELKEKKNKQKNEYKKNAFVDVGQQAYALIKSKKVGGI